MNKKVKFKYCLMPSYVGNFNSKLVENLVHHMVGDPFIGSDITLEIADGSKIIILYKEPYDENIS